MRNLMIVMAFVAAPAVAQVWVDGHVRRDGTYVPPHVRSAPNSTTMDNYGTQGNVNPYTGRTGTADPFESQNSGRSGSTYDPYGSGSSSGTSGSRRRY